MSIFGTAPHWRAGFLACLLLLPMAGKIFAQFHEGQELVRASLLADTSAIVPGKPFQVGVLLEMAPGWHTYWENPGDSGFPTSITWNLPPGFEAGPIQWPLPQRIIEPGDIQVFAYKKRVLLLTEIRPPPQVEGSAMTISAKVSWLVCEKICIPGSAEVVLDLPVNSSAAPANEALFEEFRNQLPKTGPPPFPISWQTTPEFSLLEVRDVPPDTAVDFFTLTEHAIHPEITRAGDAVQIRLTGPPPMRGLLVAGSENSQGWVLDSAVGGVEAPAVQAADVKPAVPTTGLAMALFYGFLGGLILNLMPCVLPVISLKIFGFIRQAGEEPRKIFLHGLAFTGGIFAWFLGLAAVIAIIRMSGGQATWAFQFQNPWFNLAIAILVFAFALNLFGVFELVLPGKAASALDQTGAGEGLGASFFQGVFATLLATPCTAPFLGTALGFAFSQPPLVIFGMFAAVSAGMALPYLILSAQPAWLRILPKPGPWMESLKQFMGFPLLATLLWLLYVLGNQKGLEGVIWVSCFLLCLGLALWIYGHFCGPQKSPRTRGISLVLAALTLGLGFWYFILQKFESSRLEERSGVVSKDEFPWVPFSEQTLQDLLAEGKPVFVDFTADWCISCKFNERTAIDRPAVREAFEKFGITALKADWTNNNPEITKALAAYGRVGVPFYIFYPAGRPSEPIILPEILTENMVLEAAARAAGP